MDIDVITSDVETSHLSIRQEANHANVLRKYPLILWGVVAGYSQTNPVIRQYKTFSGQRRNREREERRNMAPTICRSGTCR